MRSQGQFSLTANDCLKDLPERHRLKRDRDEEGRCTGMEEEHKREKTKFHFFIFKG